jgi:xylulokinase
MKVAIGVDVGTTGARGVAVDEAGRVVAATASQYPMLTPRPQWTEQDPREWWRAVRQVAGDLARLVGRRGGTLAGIGLTGQMHGSVFLDASGDVIRPALLWNDQRTARQCEWITERIGARRLIEITGNPALTGFQAPKIVWLRDEEPRSYQRVSQVLLPKDYVRYRLTRELATDASDAAGTLLLDLRARNWSGEVCEALEIDAEWLPKICESSDAAGTVSDSVAKDLGVPPALPVAAGGGDNACAAIGTGIVRPGTVSSSIGTSGVLFAHADRPVIDLTGQVHAFCHAVPGAYCLLGVTLSAGGSLRWWRDLTGHDYESLVAEAERVPVGAEGLLFLPYLTGERTPHLDPLARGVFVGLTARHAMAHMTRAIMEGVVFSLRSGLDVMRELGVRPTEVRATGGAASVALWRRLQADIYRIPVRRPAEQEGAAYGAALLGHVAAGTFTDVAEAVSVVRLIGGADEPDPGTGALYDDLYALHRGLYDRTKDAMHSLSLLAMR